MEPSAWTGWVKRLFKRHHGSEVTPKTLRSVFITWLRDSTNAPDVLKSAAHAMKHSEQRQASKDYDQEADDRLVKAAYDFNLSYCANYTAEMPTSGGAGSSAAHAGAAAPTVAMPRPSRPGKETGMAAARAMANGGVGVGGVVIAPAAPPAVADPPVRRCCFAACMSETPTEGLRECACGNGPHHHFCSIAAGCEADASLCARCLGAPVFAPPTMAPAAAEAAVAVAPLTDAQIAERLAELHCEWVDPAKQTELRGTIETDIDGLRQLLVQMAADACTLLTPERTYRFALSEHGERRLNVTSEPPERLVDDDWQPLEGGPWVARLMRPSHQPVAHATYRSYYCALHFDPNTTSLVPSGQIRACPRHSKDPQSTHTPCPPGP